MNKVVFILAGLFILLVFPFSSAKAGNYHVKGKNLYCSDCHTLHFSQDGRVPDVPRAWGTSPQDHLLKNVTSEMCLMCHDGDNFLAPDVMHPTSNDYQSSAGYFGGEADDPNSICGHILNSTNPPPGYHGTWNKTLSCTSCHDPHGNSYYRNLRPKPGASFSDLPVTYFISTSVSTNKDKVIQQRSFDPNDFSLTYGVANIIYRQEGSVSGGQAGLSLWCSGCHTDYNYGKGLAEPWKLHPTYSISMSKAKHVVSVDQWSSLLSRPPTVTPTDGDRGDDRPFCGSCHKAHGSNHSYGLLWENAATRDRQDGQYMRDTCQACHNIGSGQYESSPHADPNSGVARVKGFARGECEHCHQQHGQGGAYDYNLFKENNKFLCLTAGCHLETPTYYPLSDKTLPEGIKARISIANDQNRGYFEANEAGQRVSGLNYRGRWPGASVYTDEQYSPHSKWPMPNDGSCINCHSPHGTASRFDMLKGAYWGIVDSGSRDANNYELCFNCHSQNGAWSPDGMRPETKLIAGYYQQSGHQIKSAGGFANPGDKLACSDCHNPHGSMGHKKNGQPNLHLLSDERPGWNGLKDTLSDPNSSRRFCLGCHVPSDKTAKDWGDPVVEGIEMKPLPKFSAHKADSKESCHSCHGHDYSQSDSENVHHPSAGSCDGCHADQGTMDSQRYTGPHAYHTDTAGLAGPKRKYAFACQMCHARESRQAKEATHGNGPVTGSQYAEVSFCDDSTTWQTQSIHQRIYRYRSLYANPYDNNSTVIPTYDSTAYTDAIGDVVDPNITWSDQSVFSVNSCSNIWCHSNANPLSLKNYPRENSYQANVSFHLTWNDHNGGHCNNCHGFTDQSGDSKWQLSSYHSKHIVGSSGQNKILCGRCHALTCNQNSNTIREDIGYFYHVNGHKDVAFFDPNGDPNALDPDAVYNEADHTCTKTCHTDKKKAVTISWAEEPAEPICGTCHAVFDPNNPDHTISKDGHFVHLIAERGPRLRGCDDCHSSSEDSTHFNGQIDFADARPLATTQVCNNCHSPGGDYDGVNDPVSGAKANWKSGGVYIKAADGSLKLKPDQGQWCVGCHDKEPAESRSDGSGVRAPNVAGDEEALTVYGVGYGYFKTGHGLNKTATYPASRINGAGAFCTDCHDAGLRHIDHVHRTYRADQDNYQAGYRLRLVDGLSRPMDIPRTGDSGPNNNPQKDYQDFALCFQCHDRTALLGNALSSGEYHQEPLRTNFYGDDILYKDTNKSVNLHLEHLSGRGYNGNNLYWTSSWQDSKDSTISCPACHNVHGSPSPRMIRHGELISTPDSNPPDKSPAINFHYLPRPPVDTPLVKSTGAEVFEQYRAGTGQVSENKICDTCHKAHASYFRSPYLDPNHITPQILRAVAWNHPGGDKGIDDGDQLVITFNVPTNGPDVLSIPSELASIFKVYQDANQKEEKSWGEPQAVAWSDAGGNSHDTLTITLGQEGATIAVGDRLELASGDLKSTIGGQSIVSSRLITGTFDCSMVMAYAGNQSLSQEPGIQEGDEVAIVFSGPTAGKEGTLTAANIDQALNLSSHHSWGQIEKIEWNDPNNDTLTITFAGGSPVSTIAVGDLITLSNIICDKSGHPLSGSIVLQGSFEPLEIPWRKPLVVYGSSSKGPPGHDVFKSIDGDPNTYWFPQGPGGWVIYDLAAQYRISQVRILSGDGGGSKVVVKIWVSEDPVYDPNLPAVLDPWEVPITIGWQECPEFDPQNGQYVIINANKRGALTDFFYEVEFKGVAPPSPP